MARPAATVSDAPAVQADTPKQELGPVFKLAAGPSEYLDQRLGLAKLSRPFIRKVFPDHWSFLLGEVALYSFVVLLLTGVFLTIWYTPSMAEVEYNGSYQLLRGLSMSQSYESTLNLSFDIRGGLLVRQIHHWSAMLFLAAMLAHSLRVFFTGAFRKPRELNWLLGVALVMLGLIEGFAGYSLPDDLLSGTGLRFVDGLIRSIPLIGTWAEFFVFGGEFPGDLIVARLYMVHILLLPALILGLIAAHLALVVYLKHTQFPGPGRTEANVVGYPIFPVYMAKAGGFFFIVFGVLVLMGGLMQINPIWSYGPYNPAEVSAGSQPDWYMGFVEGAIRIMPNWESHIGGTTWSWNVAIPGLGTMGLFFGLMALYPFIEAWVTKDKSEHHILERPRNNPTRTGFGVAAMTAYAMLWIGGGNDLVATQFHVSLNAVTYFLRVAVFVMPVIAFMATKRICIGLQRSDEERLLHGAETGIIERDPSGAYTERHAPISQGEAWTLTQHRENAALMPVESDPDLTEGQLQRENLRRRASRFYFIDTLRKPTRAELEAAQHHGDGHDGHELESGNGHNGNGHGEHGNGNGHHSIEAGATTSGSIPSQ
ncbi:cytochrome bc1 complex cytochrome b subunit [Microlunatus antarcticus]|uniref:Cytochrome bc1 complex cytochrome b subunit n=1 Tax=Microlunatus antarcticus TaxID=53388 RepID=A0A7W5JZ76_9ACTN|nr:ubiquinol-cytochrome c reductase cytochrome b subunit [Microlunatus antarcticus]MBB3328352.1 ubiquinol-cytochrome c reductase cytochrome b subunit [Microlunatus antarcticus]